MAGRKRTRSENRETKTQESPMKNPPIVKVGFMSWWNNIMLFLWWHPWASEEFDFVIISKWSRMVIDILFQAPNVSELGPSMERRTLMSNVQPAPLSYEDLANQVVWKAWVGFELLKTFCYKSFGLNNDWICEGERKHRLQHQDHHWHGFEWRGMYWIDASKDLMLNNIIRNVYNIHKKSDELYRLQGEWECMQMAYMIFFTRSHFEPKTRHATCSIFWIDS